MQWIFFGPAMLIAHWPMAGAIIGGLGLAVQLTLTVGSGRRLDRHFFREAPVFAGLLWLIFGLYETQMIALMPRIGESAPGGTLLRLDLMVLVPILYLLTGAALYSLLRQINTKK